MNAQQLAEHAGETNLVMVVTLPDRDHAFAFMRAAQEIESLLGASVCIVNLAEYKEGELPPPGSDKPGSPGWFFVGVIHGPRRDLIAPGTEEQFFTLCTDILESHGLVEEPEVMN